MIFSLLWLVLAPLPGTVFELGGEGKGCLEGRSGLSDECGSDSWRQEIEQQRPGDNDANSAAYQLASYGVGHVSDDLRADDGDGQFPSPKPMTKPPNSRCRQSETQEQEQDANITP